VAALLEGIGSAAVTAPFTAAADADCLFVIGARPTENHPVAATYLKQAVKRGATLIVADPSGHGLMRHATHALRFKGGADVALLDAMLNVVIAEGLTDAAFIAAHVDGFEALARAVAPFTPEATAPITGIAPELVRTAARAYATSRASIIFWGMGVSQHVHGTDNARCLIALAMVTGQIGRPGTGLHPLRGQNNVQGASDAGLIPMVFPDYVPVDDPDARRRFEELWGRPLNPKRGLTVVEIMHAAAAGRIKAMYVMGENPAMSDPDLAHVREALAKLEHLVVQDIFLTETAWHADVVLPASAHAEKLGTYTNTNRQVQIGRPVIAPPGAARQDLAIIGDMARGLGLDWAPPTVEAVYEEMRRAMPSLAGLPWSRLARDGVATYPADDVEHPGHDILFGDGFPTKNGRARLVPAVPTPPDEAPDADYPFLLTTGRLLEHWHTGAMTRRASMLDALEPIAVAGVNPDDARRLGVAAGAPVTVASRRGRITARVRIDPELAPGTVFLPFAFVEAAANLLTNPALDPFGKIPEFKLCAVKLAVAEAPLADAGRSDTTGGARV
jgi:formate dehydrogenase major subunit